MLFESRTAHLQFRDELVVMREGLRRGKRGAGDAPFAVSGIYA